MISYFRILVLTLSVSETTISIAVADVLRFAAEHKLPFNASKCVVRFLLLIVIFIIMNLWYMNDNKVSYKTYLICLGFRME